MPRDAFEAPGLDTWSILCIAQIRKICARRVDVGDYLDEFVGMILRAAIDILLQLNVEEKLL